MASSRRVKSPMLRKKPESWYKMKTWHLNGLIASSIISWATKSLDERQKKLHVPVKFVDTHELMKMTKKMHKKSF